MLCETGFHWVFVDIVQLFPEILHSPDDVVKISRLPDGSAGLAALRDGMACAAFQVTHNADERKFVRPQK